MWLVIGKLAIRDFFTSFHAMTWGRTFLIAPFSGFSGFLLERALDSASCAGCPPFPRQTSPFGIFVIETKNYRGWIFGSERQPQWTQQIYRTKNRFQNPLHQNHLHVKALMEFLGLPDNRFRSLVFFTGSAEFKTPMPANVLNRGLLPWITAHTATLLGPHSVEMANSRLNTLNRTTDRKQASREHLTAMKARGV